MAQEVWNELGSVDPLFKNVAFCAYKKNDLLGAVLAKIYQPKETEDFVLKGKLNDLFVTLRQSPMDILLPLN